MDLDNCTKRQEELGEQIIRLLRDHRRDGDERKKYKTRSAHQELSLRQKQLNDLWDEFDKADSAIRENCSLDLNHPYFQKDYYTEIRKISETLRKDIDRSLQMVHPEEFEEEDSNAVTNPQVVSKTGGASVSLGKFETSVTKALAEQTSPPLNPSDGAVSRSGKEESLSQSSQPTQQTLLARGSMTNLKQRYKWVMDILNNSLERARSDQATSEQFYRIKIRTMEQNWDEVSTMYRKLEDELGHEDIKEYFEMQERVSMSLLELHGGLEKSTPKLVTQQTTMKMPKVELPKFDGNYLKWQQFMDLYIEMIHNQQMSDGQKMWFLKSSLTGDAEKLVHHLSVSGANYAAAWKIITERYDNPRILVSSWISKLLSHPNSQAGNARSIRSLHDTIQECLLGLQGLRVDTSTWDPILLHLFLKKLDKDTHTLYEQSLDHPRQLPSFKKFLGFLENRFQSLEALGTKNKMEEYQSNKPSFKTLSAVASHQTDCSTCKGNHPLYKCQQFLDLPPSRRLILVKQANLCVNCLKSGHFATNCKSGNCLKCQRRHNTLLHQEADNTRASKNSGAAKVRVSTSMRPTTTSTASSTVGSALSMHNQQRALVLLGTARIRIVGPNQKTLDCRALLDSGSQINLISRRVVRSLNLMPELDSLVIEGVGQGKHKTNQRVNVKFESNTSNYSSRMEAFVLNDIISPQPSQLLEISSWKIPRNIRLADPGFNRPDKIDLLLGAEFYHELLAVGQIKLEQDLPILQNTMLGWIISGKVNRYSATTATCGICTEEEPLNEIIEKFWRLEEIGEDTSNITPADQKCVSHFDKTFQRDKNSGRFIVSLPFSRQPSELGESKEIALRRFWALEKRLSKDEQLKNQYANFMQEYLQLGHMREVDVNSIRSPHYFLPHHGVLKPDSSTTKLRVVFDASMKTSSNNSLNDLLLAGPTIQDDIFSILLRFRTPRFVFTADIEKMYRQIMVKEEDRNYQLIFWRNGQDQELKCYQLNTVTYGTTSAPYLATRCLHQLSIDNAHKFPLGANILANDFYMDDVMSGSNSLSEAIEMQQQLTHILQSAKFNLRKWCSNIPRLLRDIPTDDLAIQSDLQDKESRTLKTLGLIWNPQTDEFLINSALQVNKRITKRTALSEIAHIFDPLGIINPITITAKIFIQQLWKLKIDWDAALPMELHTTWNNFRKDLVKIRDIKIPRHLFSTKIPRKIQIHAFADASGRAFGTAIYIRATHNDGTVTVQLLCSKSRVAPIKKGTDEEIITATTIPRLELCAAKLATELTHRVTKDLKLGELETYFWTDSEIVLAWINAEASNYHRFIANRVRAIKSKTSPRQWRHVPTKQNPADIVSRGISASKLRDCTMWFYGPLYLYGPDNTWPGKLEETNTDIEKKRSRIALTATLETSSGIINRIEHHNSFGRLQRVIAYIKRFINNCKNNNQNQRFTDHLSLHELDDATQVIIREVQQQEFKEELKHLSSGRYVSSQSPLSSLSPFLDGEGILRVGGRLEAADLDYDAKHPIVLPYNHELSKSLMREIHLKYLHIGPQGLLAAVRQKYWPIKGKTMARSVVQKCIRCARARPKLMTQIMGNLPATRVQPARPFVNSGVDFFGPVWIHFKVRGKQPRKTYVAVFCCFATKATHFEVVGDLTTEAFIGALKRFIGRRGNCRNLYCDNATNFIGARNQLMEVESSIHSPSSREKITSFCTARSMEFHFIPPRAPHFGGLWEAAVKSAKHFLKRNLLSSNLTYEELETLMIEIEAILNSRPLIPLSSDPNDLTALTPGHFLIGEALTSTINARAENTSVRLGNRWKTITAIKMQFWQRWSHEYLNELQHRYKWKQRQNNIIPGTFVIIKDDNLPPMQWQLGRIVNCIRGSDDVVRVVEVRTASGLLKRPIHKLAPLPVDDNPPLPEHLQQSKAILKSDNPPRPGHLQQSKAIQKSDNARVDKEEVPRKRIKRSLGSTIATILLALITLPLSEGVPVELLPFNSQPGIYFENIGAASILASEWNIIAYYDMELYSKELQLLTNASASLGHLCRLMKAKDICGKIITQIQHLEEELVRTNELLSAPSSSNRMKRGALNFVGNVANALFGVLDSEYAGKISKTIEGIQSNEELLLSHIKNQTSFLAATVNIMNRDQETISNQFTAMSSHINALTRQTNNISRELYQDQLSQSFISLAIQTLTTISNFQRIQGSLLDVITHSQHGKISPLLIPSTQLRQELRYIKEHLPSALKLPASYLDLTTLYNLMTIEGKILPKHAIFEIKIPLISSEDFEIFRVIPVPVLVNGTFTAIQPSSPYLIINLHRDQYYSLSERDMKNCLSINHEEYLCKQGGPLHQKGSTASACEISLFNHLPDFDKCRVQKSGDGPHWIQLHNPNEWIYALLRETTLNVVCDQNTTHVTIRGSGIAKLQKDCIMKQQFLTIRGHNIYPSITRLSYSPLSNLTDAIIPVQGTTLTYPQQSFQRHIADIEVLKQSVEKFRNALPTGLPNHDIHHTMGHVGVLIAVLIIIFLVIKYYLKARKSRHIQQPTPRPRARVVASDIPRKQHQQPEIQEEFSIRIDN